MNGGCTGMFLIGVNESPESKKINVLFLCLLYSRLEGRSDSQHVTRINDSLQFLSLLRPTRLPKLEQKSSMEFSLNGTEIHWIQWIQGIW